MLTIFGATHTLTQEMMVLFAALAAFLLGIVAIAVDVVRRNQRRLEAESKPIDTSIFQSLNTAEAVPETLAAPPAGSEDSIPEDESVAPAGVSPADILPEDVRPKDIGAEEDAFAITAQESGSAPLTSEAAWTNEPAAEPAPASEPSAAEEPPAADEPADPQAAPAPLPSGAVLVCAGYGAGFGNKIVLADITLDISEQGITTLMGPVGTGKSTLLRALAGMLSQSGLFKEWGQAWYRGAALGPDNRPLLVAQRIQLIQRSALENLTYHLRDRTADLSFEKQHNWASQWLTQAGAADIIALLDRPFMELDQLSQRIVTILREAAAEPALLLIDEPTTGLSEADAAVLLAVLERLASFTPLLVSLQNQKHARRISDRILLLAGGRILADCSATEFFDAPQSQVVAQFVDTGTCTVPPPGTVPVPDAATKPAAATAAPPTPGSDSMAAIKNEIRAALAAEIFPAHEPVQEPSAFAPEPASFEPAAADPAPAEPEPVFTETAPESAMTEVEAPAAEAEPVAAERPAHEPDLAPVALEPEPAPAAFEPEPVLADGEEPDAEPMAYEPEPVMPEFDAPPAEAETVPETVAFEPEPGAPEMAAHSADPEPTVTDPAPDAVAYEPEFPAPEMETPSTGPEAVAYEPEPAAPAFDAPMTEPMAEPATPGMDVPLAEAEPAPMAYESEPVAPELDVPAAAPEPEAFEPEPAASEPDPLEQDSLAATPEPVAEEPEPEVFEEEIIVAERITGPIARGPASRDSVLIDMLPDDEEEPDAFDDLPPISLSAQMIQSVPLPPRAATSQLPDNQRNEDAAVTRYPSSAGPRGFVWIEDGRLAATPMPGFSAPIDSDLELLKLAGITVLITLTEQDFPQDVLESHGLRNVHFPIADNMAPGTGETDMLVSQMRDMLARGEVLAVHCLAGLGRTGTVLAAYMVKEKDVSAQVALNQIRRFNRQFVQTDDQEDFLVEYEVQQEQTVLLNRATDSTKYLK